MKKHFSVFFLWAALIGVAAPAFAQPLTGDEIKKLLAGNTVEQTQFVPKNMTFLSYYDADGSIMTLTESGKTNTGKWRVNEDNLLCVQWPNRAEVCIQIVKEADGTYKRVDKGEVRAIMKNITPGKLF